MQAAMAGQHNPNAAKNLHMPTFNPATQEGVMAAAQKVADYALGVSTLENENEALPEWLEDMVSNALSSSKQANVLANDVLSELSNQLGLLNGTYHGLNKRANGQETLNGARETTQRVSAAHDPYASTPWKQLLFFKQAIMTPGPGGLQPQGPAVIGGGGGGASMPPMMSGGGGGMPTPGAAQPGQPAPPGAPPGQPGAAPGSPMGGQPQQPMMPQPPTAPMTDAPPPPLPINPRPNPPSPKTSAQAQQQANILGLMEQKRIAEQGGIPGQSTQDIQSQAFASDSKTADDMADIDYNNPSKGNSEPRKGWEWKALNHAESEGSNRWMPRHFTNKHTPITELLSSPGKGALLGGLLGAGLGGVAGGVGGSLANLPSQQVAGLAAGGAGLGGLIGGVHTYGARREHDDSVMDALRHLPPGAVMGDWDNLKKQKQANSKGTFEKLAEGGAPPPLLTRQIAQDYWPELAGAALGGTAHNA